MKNKAGSSNTKQIEELLKKQQLKYFIFTHPISEKSFGTFGLEWRKLICHSTRGVFFSRRFDGVCQKIFFRGLFLSHPDLFRFFSAKEWIPVNRKVFGLPQKIELKSYFCGVQHKVMAARISLERLPSEVTTLPCVDYDRNRIFFNSHVIFNWFIFYFLLIL